MARKGIRRAGRIALRIALVLVLLVVVLAGVALAALHTAWGREQLRAQIEGTLDEIFAGDVRVGRLEGSPLDEIVLHDVEIDGPDGRTAITIETLRLDVALAPLLDNRLHVNSAVAEGVVVDVHRSAGGVLNFDGLMAPSTEPSTWDVRLANVVVRGAITYVDEKSGAVAHVDDLELTGAFGVPARGDLTATASATATWRERGLRGTVDVDLATGLTGTHVSSAHAALGDLRAAASDLHLVAGTYAGDVQLDVPAAALARFVPSPLIGDAHLQLALTPIAAATSVGIAGTVGGARLDGLVTVTPATQRIAGTVQVGGADLSAIVLDAPASALDATVTLDLALDPGQQGVAAARGEVVVAATGDVAGVAARAVSATLDVDDAHAKVRADVRGDGGLVAHLDARGGLDGERAILDDAHLVATADDVAPFLTGARGAVAADLTAQGWIDTTPHLAVQGTVDGKRLAYDVDRVRDLHVTIDATGVPDHPAGHVHAIAHQVVHEDQRIASLTVDARTRTDGSFGVAVRTQPRQAPWRIDVDAGVRLDLPRGRATIALGDHRIRTHGVDWIGRGGVITVTPAQVGIARLRTRIAGGALAVDGTLRRASGDFDARVELDAVDLAEVDRSLDLAAALHGRVDGNGHLTRRGHTWTGAVEARASGVSAIAGATPLDGSIDATLTAGRVQLAATASGAHVGIVTLALDLVPPRRLDDPDAWMHLPRDHVHAGSITVVGADLAGLAAVAGVAPPLTGTIDADLTLSPTGTVGTVHARGLDTEGLPSPIDADLAVANDAPGVGTIDAAVTMRQVGVAQARVTLAIPVRPFDVATWLRMDAAAVRGASVTVADVILDERRSHLLGLTDTWSGRGNLRIDVDPGLTGATAVIDLHGLHGGPLVRPLGAHVELTATPGSISAALTATLRGAPMLTASGSLPLGLDALWQGGLAGAGTAKLTATARLEPTRLVDVLAALGRPDHVLGTVHGDVTVAGTLDAPTGTARFFVSGGGVTTPTLRALSLDASWDGTTAVGKLRGEELDGGELALDASLDPHQLTSAAAKLVAHDFDVAPLVRLGPLRFRGVAGILDGTLRAHDAHAATTQITGRLTVTGARLPLGEDVGTMRDGTIVLGSAAGKLTAAVDGKVGSGTIRLRGEAAVQGLVPRTATADLRLRGITLIGDVATRLDAKLHADLRREHGHWRVDATVRNGNVKVPDPSGSPLHLSGAPDDMVTIINGRPPPAVAAAERPWEALLGIRPTTTFAVVHVDVGPTLIRTAELRGRVGGALTFTIGDDGVAVDGELETSEGALALFDRSYRVDHGVVTFDGSIDPLLDVRLVHDFPDLTLFVDVTERVSKPEIHLSSRPSTYTEGQLFSFLLGGSPGLQPGQEVQGAATGIASALVSNKISGLVGRYLPVQVDVLRFEAGSTTTSAALTVGKWLTRRLFVAYRRHLESRPDENTGEAEVEYWLSPGVIIQGKAGDRGHDDADLLWIKRW